MFLHREKLKKTFKNTGVYELNHDYIKKYNIPDFKPESQDRLCMVILRHKRKGIQYELKTDIDNIVFS